MQGAPGAGQREGQATGLFPGDGGRVVRACWSLANARRLQHCRVNLQHAVAAVHRVGAAPLACKPRRCACLQTTPLCLQAKKLERQLYHMRHARDYDALGLPMVSCGHGAVGRAAVQAVTVQPAAACRRVQPPLQPGQSGFPAAAAR